MKYVVTVWEAVAERRLLICAERLTIPPYLGTTIMHNVNYPRCETLDCWRSFDAHFQDGEGSVSLPVLPMKLANTSGMTICNLWPLILTKMQDKKSLTLRWRSFPRWFRERLSPFFDHQCSHYIQKEHRGTIVNILRLVVGCLNATIDRATRNAELVIGPDMSSETQWNPQVDGWGAGFGPPRSCRSGFWTVLELL